MLITKSSPLVRTWEFQAHSLLLQPLLLSAVLHQLFIFKLWQQERWKILHWKEDLVKEGVMFVLGQSWREGGGLRRMALMKVTFIALSLDTNLCLGHLLDEFWSLMCVPGSKEYLSTAEHPPVLCAVAQVPAEGLEQVWAGTSQGEGKHQRVLVQIA